MRSSIARRTLTALATLTAAALIATAASVAVSVPAQAVTYAADMTLIVQPTSAGTSIDLPLRGTLSNISVDWGDSTAVTGPLTGTYSVYGYYPALRHTYSAAGSYTIHIYGDNLTRFGPECDYSCDGGEWPLTEVVTFANTLTSLRFAFANTPITKVPATLPASVTDLSYAFQDCRSFNDPIAGWDTSNVTDMTDMFGFSGYQSDQGKGFEDNLTPNAFNQDISGWDTGAVTTMDEMFYGNTAYNQPVGSWDVSKVKTMRRMFYGTESFNQPLTWTTTSLTTVDEMFHNAFDFNQPLNIWNTATLQSADSMLLNALSFDQPLDTWAMASMQRLPGLTPSGISVQNYDKTLAAWSALPPRTGNVSYRTLYGFGLKYGAAGKPYRDILTSGSYPWTIYDAGQVSSPATIGGASITGKAEVGATLTARASGVTERPQLSYLWQSGTSSTGPWTTIAGATAQTLALTSGLKGKYVRVTISASNTVTPNPSPVTSASTSAVAGSGTPPTIASVSASGSPVVRATLTAAPTGVTGAPTLTYAWQFSSDGTTFKAITGAKSSTYVVADAQVNGYLRVVVTGSNGIRPNAVATSPRVGPIQATVPSAPTSVTATPIPGGAVTSWQAPASTGGSTITGYTAIATPPATPGARHLSVLECMTKRVGSIPPPLTCTILGLVNGVTYSFSVTASNEEGTSPRPASRPIATAGAPSAPRLLSVYVPTWRNSAVRPLGDVTAHSARATWLAPASAGGKPITAYRVRWYDSARKVFTPWTTLPATARSATISGLVPGRAYRVAVQAKNGYGYSPTAARSFTQTG